MTTIKSYPRLAALAIGVSLIVSCDTRLPTQAGGAGDDFTRPNVRLTLTPGPGTTVDASATASVSLVATDDQGISSIVTTVRNGAQVLGADSVTLSPSQKTSTRVIPLQLIGLANGTKVTVRTTVTDIGFNTRVDSLVLTVTDTIDFTKPKLVFNAPTAGGKVNVGDSLFVSAHLTDNNGLKFVTFSAVSPRGVPGLGTADTVIRYPSVTAPSVGGSFAPGVRDTTITRFLRVATPIDTITDTLIVSGIVGDRAGNVDTTRIRVFVVSGPSVIYLSPVPGDSAIAGAGLTVSIQASHAIGVASLGFRVQGDPSWPTKLDTTVVFSLATPLKVAIATATIAIPANAPPKSLITISAISRDVNGEDGSSSPITIAVRAGLPPGPRVTQSVPARLEVTDSVTITALGNGLTYVGVELRDQAGVLIRRDSVALTPPFPSTSVISMPLSLPASAQGKRVSVISFAYDQGGRIGYSLRAGATTPQSNVSAAFADTSLVVFGKTYALPANRNGTIADLMVDASRGNVFLSNINFGRLEVWEKSTNTFASQGIVVGSQPWGMALSRTAPGKDTMYVANSGGTNLSRVFIGTSSAGMKEDLNNRLVTRASYMFQLTEVRDPSTGKIRITTSLPIIFSDRPQYVEQSIAGRLYVSTKPTVTAPRGTVRYMDPAAPAPDERFILDFAYRGSDPNSWVIANLDRIFVTPAPATSTANDVLTLCDHPSGSTAAMTCVSTSNGILATIQALQLSVPTTDVDYAVNIDFNSLGLTDTTFVAASGDGKWITFGEGNTGRTARNFILQDDGSVPDRPSLISGSLNVLDLISNQSDQIFGVALDKTGKTLGVHGTETSFSAITFPFTQRLQGKRSTFATGAGIAFHPNADGPGTANPMERLAFVASANGTIEAVDIAYYDFVRGALATKFNLYGPLRSSLPFPGDAPSVLFKLFGLSSKGLVVIDVTAADLLPGP
ncbi:MAG: hypothetical protein JWL61_731 [Gemmatimonadetes bacterium]|nr:hypothetical protein [Gemmatimonadota bacterium]